MSKTESFSYRSHFPFFRQLIDKETGLKYEKRALLASMGFHQGESYDGYACFSGGSLNSFSSAIEALLSNDKTVVIRRIHDGGRNGGGYPCCYLLEADDYQQKLLFNSEGSVNGFISVDGQEVLFLENDQIDVFSTPRSDLATITGLDGHKKSEVTIRLGGGYIIQLDEVTRNGDNNCFQCSVVMVLNDLGPRLTHLDNDFAISQPHFSTKVCFYINNGKLVLNSLFHSPDLSSSSAMLASQILERLLRVLIKQDGSAILRLFSELLFYFPLERTHSISGVFSTHDDVLMTRIIDIDGPDTIAIYGGGVDFGDTPTSRLMAAQLITLDLKAEAIESQSQRWKVLLGAKVDKICFSSLLSDAIKNEIKKHVVLSNGSFSSDLSSPVVLGRLIKNQNIKWSVEDQSGVKYCRLNNSTIFYVSIVGFDLAFWVLDDGSIVDSKNILRHSQEGVKLRRQLAVMLNREPFVQAELNDIKEGD